MPVRLPSVVLFMIQSIDSRERMPDVVHPCIACVAGVRRGGKAGERPRVKRDWEDRTFLPFYGLPRRLTVALLQTGLETILSFHLLPRPPIQSCCTVPLPEWWALLGFPPYFDMMFHRLSRYIESNAFRCTELYFIRWLVPVHSWEWKSDRWYFCSLKSQPAPSSRCCQQLFWYYLSTLYQRSYLWLVNLWYPSNLYTHISCPSCPLFHLFSAVPPSFTLLNNFVNSFVLSSKSVFRSSTTTLSWPAAFPLFVDFIAFYSIDFYPVYIFPFSPWFSFRLRRYIEHLRQCLDHTSKHFEFHQKFSTTRICIPLLIAFGETRSFVLILLLQNADYASYLVKQNHQLSCLSSGRIELLTSLLQSALSLATAIALFRLVKPISVSLPLQFPLTKLPSGVSQVVVLNPV